MKHANKFNTAKFSNNQRIGNNLSEKQEHRQQAIEFAKWCLRNIKKAPSGKKYVFKHQNKVVADEHTIRELYKVFVIDEKYNF